jgi:hypothetical protein
VEAAPAKEFYIAVPDPSDATKPVTFEPGREYTFQVSISTEANFNMNYIVFGNVAVSSWDATYNADGSVPGALGPDAMAVGDILAASSRWQKAVVAAVDAAGRPTHILALLGDATTLANFGSSNFANMAAQITYLQNNCGFTGVFDPSSVAVAWPAALDPLALNSAVSTFGMQVNTDQPVTFNAIVVSSEKTNQPQLNVLRNDGTMTTRTSTPAIPTYFPCRVLALIRY